MSAKYRVHSSIHVVGVVLLFADKMDSEGGSAGSEIFIPEDDFGETCS